MVDAAAGFVKLAGADDPNEQGRRQGGADFGDDGRGLEGGTREVGQEHTLGRALSSLGGLEIPVGLDNADEGQVAEELVDI